MPPDTFRDLIERVLPLENLPVGPRRTGQKLLQGFAAELGRAAGGSSVPAVLAETPAAAEAASTATLVRPEAPPSREELRSFSRAALPLEVRPRLDRVRQLLRVEEPPAPGDLRQPSGREALIAQWSEAGRELLGAHALRFVPPPSGDPGLGPQSDFDSELMSEVLGNPDRLYYSPDAVRTPRLARQAARGLASVVLAGVMGGGDEALGVLEIGSRTPNAFGPEELALASLMADSCAAALERIAWIEKLMFVDPLTGAYNRSYFDLQVRNEMARAARESSSMALCIVDIDDFKAFNSSFGYEGGNLVLKTVAELLRRAVRPFDTVARWGGEEFGVLLTSPLGAQDAAMICERLRSMVERQVVRIESLDRQSRRANVTVSIGVALFPDHEGTHADLWRAANQALLEAKRPPKNRVIFYRPPEGPAAS